MPTLSRYPTQRVEHTLAPRVSNIKVPFIFEVHNKLESPRFELLIHMSSEFLIHTLPSFESSANTSLSLTADHHVYGTWLTLACDTGKETSYADQSKLVLQCNNTNYNFTTETFNTGVIPTCYGMLYLHS